MWVWDFGELDDYTVLKACRVIGDTSFTDGARSIMCNKYISHKFNIFNWICWLSILPTSLNLADKGLDVPSVVCLI